MHNTRLYSIESHHDSVVLRFHTSRHLWLILAFLITALFAGIFLLGMKMGWPEEVLSGLFGGCMGLTLVTWFAIAPHLTRYTVFIDDALITLRREFYGVPVTQRKLFARNSITDLGTYPIDMRGYGNRSKPIGSLCFWANGKSIQLEPYFPIHTGVALAQDLRNAGVEFPRTYDQITADNLMYGNFRYLSF